jgi:hypothetical protein
MPEDSVIPAKAGIQMKLKHPVCRRQANIVFAPCLETEKPE